MKIVDANVLIYAVNSDSRHHHEAKSWLDAALAGPTTLGLPWVCILAFLRICTHPSIFENPLTGDQALDIVDSWLARPNVVSPEPDARHTVTLRTLIAETGVGGNLVNDAHIAALAFRHDASVVTFDRDFSRFPGVKWEIPSP
ncbi:type II toxin-antitoxin system VapC family toxin [Paramicrobacterium agarici]|uniref:Ribonuclease VapC n=1 Tax=Paramicrobacterium agarici TaxID=630514 RepID=A0A2A9DXN8_9MICO|nr:hypothetical protein ATJ78_1699 [Microbacterium agarici]TQO23764.1 hypothetical protein FB385_2624 [Microbacterium agarici]